MIEKRLLQFFVRFSISLCPRVMHSLVVRCLRQCHVTKSRSFNADQTSIDQILTIKFELYMENFLLSESFRKLKFSL